MTFTDLYSTGKHKQEIGHFANIVKIAKEDGKVTEAEEALLVKAGLNLNITLEESILVMINPEKFPLNPPANYDERIERLFRLANMIMVDGEAKLPEVKLMRKIASGLHFSSDNVEKVCDEAIHLVINKNDLNDFIIAIKKVDSV